MSNDVHVAFADAANITRLIVEKLCKEMEACGYFDFCSFQESVEKDALAVWAASTKFGHDYLEKKWFVLDIYKAGDKAAIRECWGGLTYAHSQLPPFPLSHNPDESVRIIFDEFQKYSKEFEVYMKKPNEFPKIVASYLDHKEKVRAWLCQETDSIPAPWRPY